MHILLRFPLDQPHSHSPMLSYLLVPVPLAKVCQADASLVLRGTAILRPGPLARLTGVEGDNYDFEG
ncbi:hypothetical protein ColLi_06873 [Colletotrichum liriopes]|uniref:Uncharacterized protein n=1 Tax=Colletotrichum liriopes TaxID=708192 RepID=A0AA37GN67_9PEZI|nr:hypothetical protein ColLi_06873 [Colletotrichum liriopes]